MSSLVPGSEESKEPENDTKQLFGDLIRASSSNTMHQVKNSILFPQRGKVISKKNNSLSRSVLRNSGSITPEAIVRNLGSITPSYTPNPGNAGTTTKRNSSASAGVEEKTKFQRLKNWITPSFLKKNNKTNKTNKTNLPPVLNIRPLNITKFKNINQYIKKDFIYIDITNLLGEKFIKNMIEASNCFKEDPLLKTIAYSLTSNNKLDKARIIYFKKDNKLYVYNTKEYKSYEKILLNNT